MISKRSIAHVAILFGASIASTLLVVACGGDDNDSFDVTQGVVIQNASIVNTRDGTTLPARSIVLDGGKITKISAAQANIGGSAIAVDGSGKFLVPGLMDMHTHYFDTPDQPQTAALLVANGITNIREMRGSSDLVQAAAQQNAARAAGTLDYPEILVIPGEIIGLTAIPASVSSRPSAQAATRRWRSSPRPGRRECMLQGTCRRALVPATPWQRAGRRSSTWARA
jgi:imidazolonepropionase-like amidohydrolase